MMRESRVTDMHTQFSEGSIENNPGEIADKGGDYAACRDAARVGRAAYALPDDGWTWEVDAICALLMGAWLFGLLQVLQV